jgi:5-methylcytosine-specific restriction endonuclease McrA
MRRDKPLTRRTPLTAKPQPPRRTPLRQFSAKRRQDNQQRAAVTAVLKARQVATVGYVHCERCQQPRPVDTHELLSRARGGSITDPANLALLCRRCHDAVTFHHHEIPDADRWVHTRKGQHERD